VQPASYGVAKGSCDILRLTGDLGRPVLLADDIVDTGRSIAYAVGELRPRGPGELWICILFDKRSGGRSVPSASPSPTYPSSANALITRRSIAIFRASVPSSD
jgi:hypoxanthine phosphoribosyltransferase